MRVEQVGREVVITLTRREAKRVFNYIEYAARPSMEWVHDPTGDSRYLNRKGCVTGKGGRNPDADTVMLLADAIEETGVVT